MSPLADSSGRSTRTPFSNFAPALTSATRWGAFTARHMDWADSMSLNAATPAAREPGHLVTRWRSRTVAKVDSLELFWGRPGPVEQERLAASAARSTPGCARGPRRARRSPGRDLFGRLVDMDLADEEVCGRGRTERTQQCRHLSCVASRTVERLPTTRADAVALPDLALTCQPARYGPPQTFTAAPRPAGAGTPPHTHSHHFAAEPR